MVLVGWCLFIGSVCVFLFSFCFFFVLGVFYALLARVWKCNFDDPLFSLDCRGRSSDGLCESFCF